MAPPRLQCLNATRHITNSSYGLRAAFSTSHGLKANPPRASSANDLLAALGSSLKNPSPRTANPFLRRTAPSPSLSFPNTSPRSPSSQSQTPSSAPEPDSAAIALQNLLHRTEERTAARAIRARDGNRAGGALDLVDNATATALTRQITRRWRAGEVYAPHDLSEVEMQKWKQRGRPEYDVFDVLNFNPLEHYKNFSVISEYMTPTGRIMHSDETGLRKVNQRKIAKAIRRSIGMGLTPSVHRHPEILYMNRNRVGDDRTGYMRAGSKPLPQLVGGVRG